MCGSATAGAIPWMLPLHLPILSIYPPANHPPAKGVNGKHKSNSFFAVITQLQLSHQTISTPSSVHCSRQGLVATFSVPVPSTAQLPFWGTLLSGQNTFWRREIWPPSNPICVANQLWLPSHFEHPPGSTKGTTLYPHIQGQENPLSFPPGTAMEGFHIKMPSGSF